MKIKEIFLENAASFLRSGILKFGERIVFFGNIDKSGKISKINKQEDLSEDDDFDVLIVSREFPFRPNSIELQIASECIDKKKGFYVVDTACENVEIIVSCEKKISETLSLDECSAFLSKGGALSLLFKDFEERKEQIELVRKIADSFNKNCVGVFEAGTGVGKSFAYLVPSVLWALKNREKIVISTGTINLQQQLVEKDIPLAKKVIGADFSAVLVKGRSNFVCLRRLADVFENPDLFGDFAKTFESILKWTKKSQDGDKSSIPFQVKENVWQRICSESDACMGSKCQFFEKCFVMKMRRAAAEADILVVNHHLLFADIASRLDGAGWESSAVLPPYKRLIFDEAHGIEQSATSFFSGSVHRFKVQKQLFLLCKKTRNGARGLLFTLSALASGDDKSQEIEAAIEKSRISFQKLEKEADSFLGKETSVRISAKNKSEFQKVLKKIANLQKILSEIVLSVKSIIDSIDESEKDEAVVWEANAILRRLDSFVLVLKNYSEFETFEDKVFWIERRQLPSSIAIEGELPFFVTFFQTPLDISDLMNEGVFEPMKSVVFTSATLSIAGDFSFWENRVGISKIQEKTIERAVFESPFPYQKNAILAVPCDAPFPDKADFADFVYGAVFRLIISANGRTLVLFTSYDLLRRTFEAVSQNIAESGISLLKQGDDDRFRLLSAFKEDEKSVLFATDSFWEGVDVPGKSLSQVIIVKLPFSVPSDPVFAARSEIVESDGGNAFLQLSVPEAVIRFRQGFGRLVRRASDRGAVVVLDKRLFEKRYGSTFISSVPKTVRSYSSLSKVISDIKPYL